jgi:hypothetical protein
VDLIEGEVRQSGLGRRSRKLLISEIHGTPTGGVLTGSSASLRLSSP